MRTPTEPSNNPGQSTWGTVSIAFLIVCAERHYLLRAVNVPGVYRRMPPQASMGGSLNRFVAAG
jgi:hypothetical protein